MQFYRLLDDQKKRRRTTTRRHMCDLATFSSSPSSYSLTHSLSHILYVYTYLNSVKHFVDPFVMFIFHYITHHSWWTTTTKTIWDPPNPVQPARHRMTFLLISRRLYKTQYNVLCGSVCGEKRNYFGWKSAAFCALLSNGKWLEEWMSMCDCISVCVWVCLYIIRNK